MRRNIEKMVIEGERILSRHSHYDISSYEFNLVKQLEKDDMNYSNAMLCIGIAIGARIARKQYNNDRKQGRRHI